MGIPQVSRTGEFDLKSATFYWTTAEERGATGVGLHCEYLFGCGMGGLGLLLISPKSELLLIHYSH